MCCSHASMKTRSRYISTTDDIEYKSSSEQWRRYENSNMERLPHQPNEEWHDMDLLPFSPATHPTL